MYVSKVCKTMYVYLSKLQSIKINRPGIGGLLALSMARLTTSCPVIPWEQLPKNDGLTITMGCMKKNRACDYRPDETAREKSLWWLQARSILEQFLAHTHAPAWS